MSAQVLRHPIATSIPTLACALLLSCGGSQAGRPGPCEAGRPGCGEPAPEPAAAVEEDNSDPQSAADKMWHHFWDVMHARDAVVAGELEAVRDPLQRIADGKWGMEIPNDWRDWIGEMQAQAQKGAGAKSLEEAAVAVTAVATQCGECHRTTRGGPRADANVEGYAASDGEGASLKLRMARHVWAVEQLWLGLTVPDHPAWMKGAEALVAKAEPTAEEAAAGSGTAETPAAEEAEAPEPSPMQQSFAALEDLGKRALEAGQPAAKGKLYAELLARCSSCHRDSGIGR
ncbi:MAG: hypothetical protein OEZ06_20090 [Myxococcales bacterium]|nr:hypothetical protein [Myxococcales bacterium]